MIAAKACINGLAIAGRQGSKLNKLAGPASAVLGVICPPSQIKW